MLKPKWTSTTIASLGPDSDAQLPTRATLGLRRRHTPRVKHRPRNPARYAPLLPCARTQQPVFLTPRSLCKRCRAPRAASDAELAAPAPRARGRGPETQLRQHPCGCVRYGGAHRPCLCDGALPDSRLYSGSGSAWLTRGGPDLASRSPSAAKHAARLERRQCLRAALRPVQLSLNRPLGAATKSADHRPVRRAPPSVPPPQGLRPLRRRCAPRTPGPAPAGTFPNRRASRGSRSAALRFRTGRVAAGATQPWKDPDAGCPGEGQKDPARRGWLEQCRREDSREDAGAGGPGAPTGGRRAVGVAGRD